jgi:polysaccharide export outer membrane protein
LILSLASLLVLQGCGVPGFGYVSSLSSEELNGSEKRHLIGYSPVVETAPIASYEVPVEGAVTKISQDLIRSQMLARPKTLPPELGSLFGATPIYTIGPGDVVGIVVYDHPELLPNAGAVITQQADPTGVSVAPGFIVGSGGEISFPYIGRVRMQGLTEIEASDLITKRISAYIKEPQVTVRIQSFRSRRAYIEGEVKNPGLQIFTDIPMTLAEAISRAGGITAVGDRSFVTLTRGGKTTKIDLLFIQDVGLDASGIPLVNGDVINVKSREDSKVYVMGEILRPSALLMKNGRLSLNDALGEAGGPNLLTSNPGQIYVIRSSASGSPFIFNLDAKNPAALALAEKFALAPKDVVYVDPVPLVQWNRLISLILPAAQVVNLGSEAATR